MTRSTSPYAKALDTLEAQILRRHRTLRLRLFQAGRSSQFDWIAYEPDFIATGSASGLLTFGLDIWRKRQTLSSKPPLVFALSYAQTAIDAFFDRWTPAEIRGGHRTISLADLEQDATVRRQLAERQLAPAEDCDPLDTRLLREGAASPSPYLAPADVTVPDTQAYVEARYQRGLSAFLGELPDLIGPDFPVWSDRLDVSLAELATRHGIGRSAMQTREAKVVSKVAALHRDRFGRDLPAELARRRRHPEFSPSE